MNSILDLNPKMVWKNFHDICQIPHPSKKEEKIIAYMQEFAKKNNLECITDEVCNVIIRKPATPGMENRKVVVLQAHLDMVPQKNSDTAHDFEKDPISTFIDGEWLRAKGTTLGADNGIGVAAIMTVLESTDIAHGPIEALLTIDEETGMTGAFGLKPGFLKGDILLNLDSEDEGELYVGCAGGVDATLTLNYTTEKTPANTEAYKLSVTGLKGGHSGMDIILGRGNANKIIFRILKAIYRLGAGIADINGGSLRNAIPREAFATIVIPSANKDAILKEIDSIKNIVASELSLVEPDFKVTYEAVALPATIIENKAAVTIIDTICTCPNGVLRMSDSMPGLVETSSNLAIVKSDGSKVVISCLIRSSVDTAKEDITSMFASLMNLAGGKAEFAGGYPGWKPNMNSAILKTMQEVYQKLYGKTPEIKAIHAGLECGLLGGVYPNWDMISFGPTIRNPHSPDERVHIESVGKFWNYLVETLKNIPVK